MEVGWTQKADLDLEKLKAFEAIARHRPIVLDAC
jgi:hypothetical protein